MKEENSRKFIDEPVQVGYKKEPLLKRVPPCPDHFIWREERFAIVRLLSQWSDMARRGNQSKNMRPAHLRRAEKMGSWGVGRFFFQVLVENGRKFELYYDRTPKKAAEGAGEWVLLAEILDNP